MGPAADAAVIVLYPVIVLGGLLTVGVRKTALLLLLLTGRRLIAALATSRSTSKLMLIQAVSVAAIVAAAAISGSKIVLRLTPFAIQISILAMFALSMRGMPIIERFARLQKDDLPPDQAAYCRKLTLIWIGVLLANAVLVLAAALWADDALWTILVGPVSYTLLGFVFTVEYLYRKRRFQEFDPKNGLDRILKPLLSKKATP